MTNLSASNIEKSKLRIHQKTELYLCRPIKMNNSSTNKIYLNVTSQTAFIIQLKQYNTLKNNRSEAKN